MYAMSLLSGICLSGRPLKVRMGSKGDEKQIPATSSSTTSTSEDLAAVAEMTSPPVANGSVDRIEAKLKEQFGSRLSSPSPESVYANMELSLLDEKDIAAVESHETGAATASSVPPNAALPPNLEPGPPSSSPVPLIPGVFPPLLPLPSRLPLLPAETPPSALPRPLFPHLSQVPPSPLFPPQLTFTPDQNDNLPIVPHPSLDCSHGESIVAAQKYRVLEEFASRVMSVVSCSHSNGMGNSNGDSAEVDHESASQDHNVDYISSSLEQAGSDLDHMSSEWDYTSSDRDHVSYGQEQVGSSCHDSERMVESFRSPVPENGLLQYAEEARYYSDDNFLENNTSFSNNFENETDQMDLLRIFCHNTSPRPEGCNNEKFGCHSNHGQRRSDRRRGKKSKVGSGMKLHGEFAAGMKTTNGKNTPWAVGKKRNRNEKFPRR